MVCTNLSSVARSSLSGIVRLAALLLASRDVLARRALGLLVLVRCHVASSLCAGLQYGRQCLCTCQPIKTNVMVFSRSIRLAAAQMRYVQHTGFV